MRRIIDMLLLYIYVYVILVLPVERYFNYILCHYYPSLHDGKKNFRNFMFPPLIT